MRSVHVTDLTIAARTLLGVCPAQRVVFVRSIIRDAHAADKYRKHTGRAHPVLGHGNLADACAHHAKPSMPAFCTADYLDCLAIVVTACRYQHL
jgi:hypothetical protein